MSSGLIRARNYARSLGPVFPCGPNKNPLVKGGLHAATRDEEQICEWWGDKPGALIGLPTGPTSGAVVLDVDVKNGEWGFDTLDELGFSILPDTPMVHTPSGGLHIYFKPPSIELRNTAGERGGGVGRGLDWRGDGGYVIMPGPGGYWWDPHHNIETDLLAEVPPALLPRTQAREVPMEPVRPTSGLSPYAEAALRSACSNIASAPSGTQESTLHQECFSIGTLASAAGIPADFARRALLTAALQMRDYDQRRPWRSDAIQKKVLRSFSAGLGHPRTAANGS